MVRQFFLLLLAVGLATSITVKLNSNNKMVCFYIRGDAVDSEFILNYGYSGDGFQNFKKIKEQTYIFEQKTGDPMAVNGYVANNVEPDQIYSICFESLDDQSKQVAFSYDQAKRQKHFTKNDMMNAGITLGEIVENQIKLDTRLSYFQSNIFAHTESSPGPNEVMENHKSSLIWSSLTKLGAMLLVGGIQINLLVELLAATKSKITDIL